MNRAEMETLGLLIPGPRSANGARMTRPTFPTRHLVRPILHIAHRMSGLDMAAYHRGEDGDDEDIMDGLPVIEAETHWDISDVGSEWEAIGPLVSDLDVDKICGGEDNAEDDDNISVGLGRQEEGDRALCTDTQELDRSSDAWEVISQEPEISEQQQVVSMTTSKPSSPRIANGKRVVIAPKQGDRKKEAKNVRPGK